MLLDDSSTGFWVLVAMFAPRLPIVLWHNRRLPSADQPAGPA